ncbi:hypothetical protein HDV57DRAFT_299158 [Trichoderma longibrachiatum]|uniref:Uncharacterized protein n=1 Tax=Trichoderma longibrachiatum ATCC 18648 TaxID=983965 RepID=A0A2T4CCI8_TRILO|nr:hypothetical protein M440DRAFT_1165461 [Trichoderma longibrachiatum ATCC 18648]
MPPSATQGLIDYFLLRPHHSHASVCLIPFTTLVAALAQHPSAYSQPIPGIMAFKHARRSCAALVDPVHLASTIFPKHRFASRRPHCHIHSLLNSRSAIPCTILIPQTRNHNTITQATKKHTKPLTSPLAARRPICATNTHKSIVSHPCSLSSSPFPLTVDDDFLFSFSKQESAIPRGMHDRHALRMKRIWDWGCLENSASSQSLCKRLKYIWTQAGLTVF